MRIERIDASNAHLFMSGFTDDGGFYRRLMEIKPGKPHNGHSHYINHTGELLTGDGVRIHWHHEHDLDDCGVTEVLAPFVTIDIKANYWHSFELIGGPVLWRCWFAKAEADLVYGDASKVPWHLEKPHV
jgi:hypothetical protein